MATARQTHGRTRGRASSADSAAAPPKRPLASNFSYRLAYLSFLVVRATAPVLAAHGLTNQQWKVLSMLSQIAPATAQELTRWLTLDKSAVSRAVKLLLEQKLIGRRLHAQDARNVHLFLTSRGAALYARVARQLALMHENLLQDIPRAELLRIFESFDRIEQRLSGPGQAQT